LPDSLGCRAFCVYIDYQLFSTIHARKTKPYKTREFKQCSKNVVKEILWQS